jgi:hypothetical protein
LKHDSATLKHDSATLKHDSATLKHDSATLKHDSAMVWLLTASSVPALLCCAEVPLDALVAVAVADGNGGAGYDDDALPHEPYAFVGSWPMPTQCGIVVAAAGVIP